MQLMYSTFRFLIVDFNCTETTATKNLQLEFECLHVGENCKVMESQKRKPNSSFQEIAGISQFRTIAGLFLKCYFLCKIRTKIRINYFILD